MWKVCWSKGRLYWKIAKLFHFCHLSKLARPETYGPYHVHIYMMLCHTCNIKKSKISLRCKYNIAEKQMLNHEVPLHMFMLVCGLLQVQLALLCPFHASPKSYTHTNILHTSWYHFLNTCLVMGESMTFFSNTVHSSHHKQFYKLFTEHCLWNNNRICRGLWLPHSPDLNLWNFYLWSMLKDKLCTNYHHRKTIWKENQNVVSSISTWETECVTNTLVTCHTFLWRKGIHFQHLP